MESPESLFREASAYRTVRSADWQGPEARGGPKLSAGGPATSNSVAADQFTSSAALSSRAPVNEPPNASEMQLWERVERMLGPQRGKKVVQLMKQHTTNYVRSLSLAEIERMA